MRNQVQLIAYADRLGGSLGGLHRLLCGPLDGMFGGVHVLPFFRPYDGADAGFDPAEHTEVDSRLGSWSDVARLAEGRDLVVDVIVNHISAHSEQFRDFLAHGPGSRYAGMFLTLGSVFPHGAREADLTRIYRPRPGLPFTAYRVGPDGQARLMWTTFTAEQIDIDVTDPQGAAYLDAVLSRLAEAGVAMVRLDAVGYAVKTAGTSCFMTRETFDFIDALTGGARSLGMEVLVELHSHYQRQVEIARRVDWVYDFALPPLVLHALFTGDASRLLHWLRVRPVNAVTVLDTHDGIGVIDVGADAEDPTRPGLLAPDEIDELVERIHRNSAGTSRAATGAAASNLDLYQVNCTFYDALGRDDERYLLARAIQVFTPGVPQVYYVGLLAGGNDTELLARTGVGRDVNRHHYSDAEIASALDRPVVAALTRLLRWRNRVPAFGGQFSCWAGEVDDGRPDEADPGVLTLQWRHGGSHARLTARLDDASCRLSWRDESGEHAVSAVADLP